MGGQTQCLEWPWQNHGEKSMKQLPRNKAKHDASCEELVSERTSCNVWKVKRYNIWRDSMVEKYLQTGFLYISHFVDNDSLKQTLSISDLLCFNNLWVVKINHFQTVGRVCLFYFSDHFLTTANNGYRTTAKAANVTEWEYQLQTLLNEKINCKYYLQLKFSI